MRLSLLQYNGAHCTNVPKYIPIPKKLQMKLAQGYRDGCEKQGEIFAQDLSLCKVEKVAPHARKLKQKFSPRISQTFLSARPRKYCLARDVAQPRLACCNPYKIYSYMYKISYVLEMTICMPSQVLMAKITINLLTYNPFLIF